MVRDGSQPGQEFLQYRLQCTIVVWATRVAKKTSLQQNIGENFVTDRQSVSYKISSFATCVMYEMALTTK